MQTKPDRGSIASGVIRLSGPQLRVLRNLADGWPADVGLHGRSQYGGHVSVMRALRKRGLIDEEDKITAAGRSVFAG